MEIGQDYKDNAAVGIDRVALKLDHPYPNCNDDCSSIKIEEVGISKCHDDDSITTTFENMGDNKAPVKVGFEKIKNENFAEIDILHYIFDSGIQTENITSTNATCDLPLNRMKNEQGVGNGECSKLTSDTKEHLKEHLIKMEEDMLAVNIEVEEQESVMNSMKLEVLTEELDIKPGNAVSNSENLHAELDRMENEQSVENGEPSELTSDTKEHLKEHNMKMEEDMLAVDVEVGEQEYVMNSIKLEVLTEELDIKPGSDVSNSENLHVESDRMKNEQSVEDEELSKLISDTREHLKERNIKIEEDMLAVDVKVDEQESVMDSIKLEVWTEELDIKPTSDVSNGRNLHAELDRAAKKDIGGEEHGVVRGRANKGSFICCYCNLIVESQKDLIYHFDVGGCRVKSRAKKTFKSTQCTHCYLIFKHKIALDDHVIKKHKEFIASVSSKIHRCKYCSFETTFSSHLARHAEKHPEIGFSVKKHPCSHCDTTLRSKKALDDHVIKKHEEFIASVSSKILDCKHCSYKTTITHLFTRHMTKHPGTGYYVEPKKLPCVHCDAVFRSKAGLHDHIIRKHKEFIGSLSSKIRECKYCGYKTANSSRLASHMTKHPESGSSVKPKLRTCIHCNAIFKSKVHLDDHIIKKHDEFIASVSSKMHECKYCSYKTTITSLLAGHMTKHPESGCSVERHTCIHCDKTFKSRIALDDHVIKNHKEGISSISSKIHECQHCTYKTTMTADLARHMSKHPESGCSVERHPCIHCDAIFKTQAGLDDHIVRKHEEFSATVSSETYECSHCSYKTAISNNFSRHMKIHRETGYSVKENPCIHCNKTFKSKIGLYDHVVKQHNEFIASVPFKIHQCKYCSYKTIVSSHLASHMKNHPETNRMKYLSRIGKT